MIDVTKEVYCISCEADYNMDDPTRCTIIVNINRTMTVREILDDDALEGLYRSELLHLFNWGDDIGFAGIDGFTTIIAATKDLAIKAMVDKLVEETEHKRLLTKMLQKGGKVFHYHDPR